MQGKARIASRPLAVDPVEAVVLRRDTPNCCSVTCVKIIDRAPDVGRSTAVINEKGVRSTAASQEVGTGATVQHIGSATDRNRVVAAAAVDKPIWACCVNVEA